MEYQINKLMDNSGVSFGTSGARGLVTDMTDSVCFAYTLAFLQFARQTAEPDTEQSTEPNTAFDRVAVGHDLRSSSPRIAHAVCRAIEHFGLKAIDCGAVPSPVLTLYGFSEKIPTVIVTGSHIPDDRNGLKFTLPGREVLKNDEVAIREQTVDIPDSLFDTENMLKPESACKTVESDGGEAKRRYIDRFVRGLPKNFLTGFRIGLYEHSAVGRDILYELYTTLGATVTRLGRCETFSAVDTEAIREEDIILAKQWAAGDHRSDEPPFDAILSTDGDSDRPLVFDEHGQWVRGDVLGILTARFLLADCVVTPVSSSSALELSGWFPKTIRTKIGSPYVIEAMQNAVKQGERRVVGYEANGGFLTASPLMLDFDDYERTLDPLLTRDPAIVHIACLCYARMSGVPLSEMVNYLPRRVVMSDRLRNFPTEISRQKIEELQAGGEETVQLVFAGFGELQAIDNTDGIRMTFGDNAVVHLRASGNAPELRCYTEADTRDRAAHLLYQTMTILDSWRRRDQQDTYPYRQ